MENVLDIFNPTVSTIVEGVQGKKILVYGDNGTGKTYNFVNPRTLVLAVEKGLNGLAGAKYIQITSWTHLLKIAKQILDPANRDQLLKTYDRIVVDGLDLVDTMCSKYLCSVLGINSIGEGRGGFGCWDEYKAEFQKFTRPLLAEDNPFTVICIDHRAERKFNNTDGGEFKTIYPAGEKRFIDPICNACDFIMYVEIPTDSTLSTAYFKRTRAYHARSRFRYMVDSIPEWNLEKLEAAIDDAIAQEKEANNGGVISMAEHEKKAAKEAKKVKPLNTIVEEVAGILGKMSKEACDKYYKEGILDGVLHNKEFRCTKATENDREVVELVLSELKKLPAEAFTA